MDTQAGRRPTREARLPPLRALAAAAALVIAAWAAGLPHPAAAQGQAADKPQKAPPAVPAKPDAPKAAAARAAATKAAAPRAAAPRAAAAKAAPKAPVAARNIAVGAAAVAAAPAAFLSHGCLDVAHGRWLSNELGGAAGGAQAGAFGGVLGSVLAELPRQGAAGDPSPAAAASAPEPMPEGGLPSAPVAEGALAPAAPAAGLPPLAAEPSGPQSSAPAGHCVPFASVRTPGRHIESMALLPAAYAPAGAAERRAMVVSRKEAAPTSTNWLDLGELPALRPEANSEVWLPVASLLSGEAGNVPARWLREVSLLVRNMKRQPEAAGASWMRLVLSGEGEAARPAAVELVDEGGNAVDSAIWVDRTELPGGFVSALGGDYERMLWQAPVDYTRISRGVGSAIVVTRKRVFAQPKTPGGKPRMVVRSFRSHGQHQGIDYVAPTGTPVVAVADGTVVHQGPNGGYGNLVVLDHGGGITTYYAHLSAFGAGVQEGARIERGQEIGLVGSTGRSTGPHLHFEIRKDGKYLDPADPKQTLPNWSLGAEEHEAVLTRLLALSVSRPQEFAKAVRPATMAAARVNLTTAAE